MSAAYDGTRLKGLKTQLAKAHAELDLARSEQSDVSRRITDIQNRIEALKADIEKAAPPSKIVVTEHAIVRYCERVLGLDLNDIRKKIATPEIEEWSQTLGRTGLFPADGFKVRLKDGVAVTIIDN